VNKALYHPRYWISWLGILFTRCLCLLPLSILLIFGQWLGRISANSALLRRRRHIAEVNVRLCFPERSSEQQQQLVTDIIISTYLGMLETVYSWWASDDELRRRTDYEGVELIDAAKAQGQGVLLIGSHFTTLDLAGRLLRLKVDVDSSYQKQKNPVFDYCILKYRLKRFTNMVEKKQMRRLIKLVKSGRAMWYATDQDFGRKNSVFVPFFGHQTATLSTIGTLLKLTKAKPLYFSHYRIGKGKDTRYLIRITDPFEDQFNDDDVNNATVLNRVIEQAVRVAPEQYLWVHRRFKTRPNKTDAKLYATKKKKNR
jgi:KDO2-lipid IV(A) lauroyltransferase